MPSLAGYLFYVLASLDLIYTKSALPPLFLHFRKDKPVLSLLNLQRSSPVSESKRYIKCIINQNLKKPLIPFMFSSWIYNFWRFFNLKNAQWQSWGFHITLLLYFSNLIKVLLIGVACHRELVLSLMLDPEIDKRVFEKLFERSKVLVSRVGVRFQSFTRTCIDGRPSELFL